MAFDSYINIDGIKGEATDDKHKDWIEVLSYSHHMAMPVSNTRSSAGGGTSGRTQHGDFVVTKYIDLSSPKLYEAVSTGKHFGKVTFDMCRAGGSQVPYLQITMEQVVISNVHQNGPKGRGASGSASAGPSDADVLPTETVSLTTARSSGSTRSRSASTGLVAVTPARNTTWSRRREPESIHSRSGLLQRSPASADSSGCSGAGRSASEEGDGVILKLVDARRLGEDVT